MRRMLKYAATAALWLAAFPEPRLLADDVAALRWAPRDAAFFSASLHLKDQFQALAESNVAQRLMQTELAQSAVARARQELENPDSPAFMAWNMLQLPENQELLALLGDMFDNEVVAYGDQGWADLLSLVQSLSNQSNFSQIGNVAAGDFDAIVEQGDAAGAHAIFQMLQERRGDLHIPQIVWAFHIDDAERAARQLKRLEVVVNLLLSQLDQPPPGEIAPLRAGEFNGLGWTIPFESVGLGSDGIGPMFEVLEQVETYPGEFDAFVNHLLQLQASIAVGVWRDYVIVSVANDFSHLEALGQGDFLAEAPEMQMLARHADRKILSMSYVSPAFLEAAASQDETFALMRDTASRVRENPNLPEDLQERIINDVDEFTADLRTVSGKPGGQLGLAFSSPYGTEGVAYDWTEYPYIDDSRPLELLHHVGASPWFVLIGRSAGSREQFDVLAKWIERGFGYFVDFGVPQIEGEEEQAKARRAVEILTATGSQAAEVFREKLLPALADGQVGLVVDGEYRSRQPFAEMEPLDFEIAWPEPAAVVGVTDRDLLIEAAAELRVLVNEGYAQLREIEPEQFTPFELPEPLSQSIPGGVMYFYSLPPGVVEEAIVPNVSLSDHVLAFTTTAAHSERLLEENDSFSNVQVIDVESPATTVVRLDFAAVWEDYGPLVAMGRGMASAMLHTVDQEEMQRETGLTLGDREELLSLAFEILQCPKRADMVVRREEDVTVSHSIFVVEDVAATGASSP